MDFCQYNSGETAEQQQAETTANITDVTPKKAFTMGNNIDYRKWNYKLRFQVKKMSDERDRLSDEVSLLKSKCRGLELELSENKFYTTKECLQMMSEQAKTISNYAQMYSDLLKENFELKRQKNPT